MNKIRVPYIDLVGQHSEIKNELLDAMDRVLSHGQFILGPEVTEFEERFADYCGTKYAVGVDNGTSALFLTMRCLGIGSGDEVITAPNSFLASASSIALTGARPVFVDVREDFNIDPNLIEAAITPCTKALMPVHLTGRPADMYPIMELAEKHGLHIIEDSAQAVGARYHGKTVGSFGIAGCFSLHPLKNLNAVGDGGIITTDDPDLYKKLRMARNHGLRNRDECEFWSYNCRLDTIQAAMLLVKMKYLDEWKEARRSNAGYYREQLKNIVKVPEEAPHEHCVYHTFIIQAENRDALQKYLLEHGIETKIHYPIPIHLQKVAHEFVATKGSFPVTEQQVKTIMSLPVYPELTENQQRHVVSGICRFYEGK